MQKDRRSHKFINRWAQIRVSLEVVLYALMYVTLLAMILFVPPFVNMFSKYSPDDHQAIAKELFYLNYPKWPLFLLLAVFIGLASILFSHRIVGPAYQLEKGLNALIDGQLNVVLKFRKWDFFMELQDRFNKLSLKLRGDLTSVAEEQDKALSICREMRAQSSSDKLTRLEEHLVSIENTLKNYRN